jgi:hypothetical protein
MKTRYSTQQDWECKACGAKSGKKLNGEFVDPIEIVLSHDLKQDTLQAVKRLVQKAHKKVSPGCKPGKGQLRLENAIYGKEQPEQTLE